MLETSGTQQQGLRDMGTHPPAQHALSVLCVPVARPRLSPPLEPHGPWVAFTHSPYPAPWALQRRAHLPCGWLAVYVYVLGMFLPHPKHQAALRSTPLYYLFPQRLGRGSLSPFLAHTKYRQARAHLTGVLGRHRKLMYPDAQHQANQGIQDS